MSEYTKTDPHHEKMYYHSFIVEGRGDFPIDMLRYDRAFPTEGFHAITRDFKKEDRMTPRRVKLATWHHFRFWEPTTLRWQSFGWSVVPTHLY